ncbi:tyrosine-protein kinase transmembrane receptor Ror [Neodiprion pinetum]|uniref:Tyrosine-protein kinase transmembrane receptor Ror n=1 Tax=Neodiprion lecontei TaxID=441921 RepID=A0A6J0BBE5_NEOLC|nr:tyrosine-protein kinase transmembrane receptor Ror [Neodiprion lecontei]XP_046466028.1 tyrosine-protein kinase transmembrane receptor Ror-like [Neodiprion pinetum]
MAPNRPAKLRRALKQADFKPGPIVTAGLPLEQSEDSTIRWQQAAIALNRTIINCHGNPQICGPEAACKNFGNDTAICICPHDSSIPTAALTCPRITVPMEPMPIHNIIPPNGNITNSTTELPDKKEVPTTAQVGPSHQRKLPEIIGGTATLLILIGLIILARYCQRRRAYTSKCSRTSLNPSPMNLKKGFLLPNKYIPNTQYSTYGSPEVPILRRDCVLFLQDIGEGCFGKVYKGQLRRGDATETVAVKVLKDSASCEAEEDFMREVDIMSSFRHRNILFLIGVVLRDATNSPWMVFEYMPHGDLAEVLRANSRQLRCSTPGLPPLTRDSLLWISTQIAAGMTYLSSQRFVHRDLACRNCLVGSDLIVKIADFGMSRDVYTCDYYKIGGSRLLPVRWMAPESVIFGRFTLESDVWSFGVVIWEVYSFGKQPYYGHNNDEVMKLILQGIMLLPPEDCPPFICDVMRGCWKTEPKDRLKFTDILEKLELAREKSSDKGSLPRPPQGPVAIRSPDALDTDGYLLPAPVNRCEYLQPLPPLPN